MKRKTEKNFEISKDPRVCDEFNRLSKIFEEIDPDKRGVVLNLMQNAAFMNTSLRDLQDLIAQDGWVSTYDNGGGQGGQKQSPASSSYMKLVATYNSVIKTLLDLLPKSDRDAARAQADPMAEFLSK